MENTSLAKKVADEFNKLPEVAAIVLGGSQSGGIVDAHSDLDFYIYAETVAPLSERKAIVENLGASRADLNLTFWDTGDEWFDADTGTEIDVMYWAPAWIEGQLDRVLNQHLASLGYTTCFWHTVKESTILFDRDGWFGELQDKSNQPYPEPLKRAILAKNHPVLRNVIPSYYAQIKKALDRRDLVSVNHRVAALYASYFDVLFALNEVSHPGEKKLIRFATSQCPKIPDALERKIERILRWAAAGDARLLMALDEFLDDLDEILADAGFDPRKTLFADAKD